MRLTRLICGLFALFVFVPPTWAAQENARQQDDFRSDGGNYKQFPPFRIAGNLYYVGSYNQSSYLIATPQGLILINSGWKDSPPLIRKSIEKLGFRFSDIKIVLISHAHSDHAGGSEDIIKQTGAKYEVMEADVPTIESGGKLDFNYGDSAKDQYPKAHVDRTLHDGDTVSLGGMVLTAHWTPGHTKGCTTWTFDETENGRVLHVVVIGGTALNPGYKLVNYPVYPELADDLKKTYAVLAALPCDIYLGAHTWYFNMKDKYPKLQAGDKNAFIDPGGYKAYIAAQESGFERTLAKALAGEAQSVH